MLDVAFLHGSLEHDRYVGEVVAAVAATDLKIAGQAAAAIEIEYEPLPAVLSIDQALAPGAPILHEEYASYFKAIQGGGHGIVRYCPFSVV
jgi:CO/xanthine dehydrogenase Mo-binding subunit